MVKVGSESSGSARGVALKHAVNASPTITSRASGTSIHRLHLNHIFLQQCNHVSNSVISQKVILKYFLHVLIPKLSKIAALPETPITELYMKNN